MVRALPADSALAELQRGMPLEEVWTVEHELLATVAELVSVGASEKHRLRRPVEIPRPHQQAGGHSEALPPGEAAQQLAAMGVRVRRPA